MKRIALTIGLFTLFTLVESCWADEAAIKRQQIIAESFKAADKHLEEWKAATTNKEAARAADSLIAAGNDCFQKLKDADLLNAKLQAYHTHWEHLSAVVQKNANKKGLLEQLDDFIKNLKLAAIGGRCTVSVTTSNGDGATIKYAKIADVDKPFMTLGQSPVLKEIEKGDYDFKSYRGDTETGDSGRTPCTDPDKAVPVKITENP